MNDSFSAGCNYLDALRALLPRPELIARVEDGASRRLICEGIGQQIPAVNHYLQDCVAACADCFHPWQRRSIQIQAAPFADAFALDGVCLLHTQPVTILVDVGRVIPDDWLAVVVHEYAHAHLAQPGHSPRFALTLRHLCWGLGLEGSTGIPLDSDLWSTWPPLRHPPSPRHFWQTLAR